MRSSREKGGHCENRTWLRVEYQGLDATAELEPEPRADIWGSDMGKPYIDRWLQMKGVPYSNPPTGKSLMAFFLGRQIEMGVEQMLMRCGVGYRSQERLTVQYPDCLPVETGSGRAGDQLARHHRGGRRESGGFPWRSPED